MATLTAISFDKPSYTPGQTVTATVTGTGLDATATVTAALNGGGSVSGQLVVNFVSVSDTGNRVWTEVSNNGTTAVFTSTA